MRLLTVTLQVVQSGAGLIVAFSQLVANRYSSVWIPLDVSKWVAHLGAASNLIGPHALTVFTVSTSSMMSS